jgi:isopenicillin-N epimerase
VDLRHIAEQFQLRKDMTFLNHGSFGACPRPVFAVYQQWQRELEAQPVEFLARRLPELLAEARAALGAYLAVPGDALAFVPNATHAMNIIARSLDLQPGDEVLGTDHEYGAVARTWRFVCAQRGARYVSQPIALPLHAPADVVAQLWAGVTARTRAMVLSHITSPTALIFPVEELCRRARAAGMVSIVDGAHAPGQIDLDLNALGADCYVGNCHKWLCAPKGAGFLYARTEAQQWLQPLVVSWGWDADVPGPSRFVDHFGWTGTADPSAYLSVPAAIQFQHDHGWPEVRRACRALLADARRQLALLAGQGHICPDGPEWWGQMAAVPLPLHPSNAAHLQARLWQRDRIEVPIIAWGDQTLVRVSVQAYNTTEDVERLIAALRAHLLAP